MRASLSLLLALAVAARSATLIDGSEVIDLGSLGGTGLGGGAAAVNAAGQVVGSDFTAAGDEHAFLWQDGEMQDLGTLGGRRSRATGINRAAQVVGSAEIPSGDNHAFLWQDASMQDLGTLGGPRSFAYAINAAGQIVGISETASLDYHAFLWQDGTMLDLGTLSESPGGRLSQANAINDVGQVAGFSRNAAGLNHAVVWENGTIRDLGVPDGFSQTFATGINNAGQVVAFSPVPGPGDGDVYHTILWQADGTVSDLGTFGLKFGASPSGINEAGQVVGFGRDERRQFHSYFWSPTDGMEDLTAATGLEIAKAITGLMVAGSLTPLGPAALVKLSFVPSPATKRRADVHHVGAEL